MSTPALKPVRVSSLLFDSGQIEKSRARFDFDPKKRREELRARQPLQSAPPEQAQHRQFAIAFSEDARADLERLMNQNDLMSVNYLERGMIAGKAVGRIQVRDSTGRSLGWGTGFMISEKLLITNHHVLDTSEAAASSQVEFNYELDCDGRPEQSEIFSLKPEEFFHTNEELDYSVVAVESQSVRGTAVSAFGSLPLMGLKDKVLEGEYVSCIEHPGAEYKEVALRENQIIKKLENFLWYMTDTAPGASGSPMFNDSWQVVALHHSGKPATDENGNVLAIDNQVWRPEMGEDKVKWIANEGVRISSIVADLIASCGENDLLKEAIPDSGSRVIEISPIQRPVSRRRVGPQIVLPSADAAAVVRPTEITVPVNLKISIGESVPVVQVEKAAKVSGYNDAFLGKKVPVPVLDKTQIRDIATCKGSLTIPYTHFSVCLSKLHRMAYFVAWNINGDQLKRLPRKNLKFKFDSRIAAEYQIGDAIYANNTLDRGHLARRADLVWGTAAEARQANVDSFNFTNITPQHQGFNQSEKGGLWGELENALFEDVSVDGLRASLMAGPVFKQTDQEYRGIRIPSDFWKVLTYVDEEDNKLKAKAYVLTQKNLLDDIEAFALDPFRLYQVSIEELEKLTGFSFGDLRNADTFTTAMVTEAVAAGAKKMVREVTSRENLLG